MMQILGPKRAFMLAALVGVLCTIAAATYLYIMPESQKLERQLAGIRAEISQKRQEADSMRNDYELIISQKAFYDNLENAKFISDQNRLEARRRISEIQQYSGVLQASYDISAASVVANEDLQGTNYVVLSTPISMKLEAIDDVAVFNYLYWMENSFPGHVSITAFEIERKGDVTESVLREIGSGDLLSLVDAKVDVVWRTISTRSTADDLSQISDEGF